MSDFGNPGGGGTGGPIFYADQQLQYSANANWVKGSHNVRFGVELVQQSFNHFEATAAAGQFSFSGNRSNLQLNADGTIKDLGGYSEITSTTGTGREGIDERIFRFGLRVRF